MRAPREWRPRSPETPVELVDELLRIFDEDDILVEACGVSAVARASRRDQKLFKLAEFISALPPDLLDQLAAARHTGNWTSYREFARQVRAQEREIERNDALKRAAECATAAGRHVA